MVRALLLVLSTVALVVSSGCTGGAPQGDASLSGTELARRILIVDTHIDVPYRLR